jgi:tRNA(Ile)-lysidine synthetase-like protein
MGVSLAYVQYRRVSRTLPKSGPTSPDTSGKVVYTPGLRDALRRLSAATSIASSWRRLTQPPGGRTRDVDSQRGTLLAVSGGTDSSALGLALVSHAARGTPLVIAHIVHDMRPSHEALEDLARVQELAERLNVPCVWQAIQARPEGGNLEATSRRLRYKALAHLAKAHNCPFVATAHHADDLLETMLMRLVRGAGPRGLVGIPDSRSLHGCQLIRPMLDVMRTDAQAICHIAGWSPVEDATNSDPARLRSQLRMQILPALRALVPQAAFRARATSQVMHSVAEMLDRWCWGEGALISPGARFVETRLQRSKLRALPAGLLAELLRSAAAHNKQDDPDEHGSIARDDVPHRVIDALVRLIRSSKTDPKVVRLGGRDGVLVHVRAREVIIQPADAR